MSSLGDLSELVGALKDRNQESLKVLNCVESKLVDMDLDLESWLLNQPLTCQTAVIDGKPHVITQVIGFGPHNGAHALLVKELIHAQEDEWESKGIHSYGVAKPLREASRELRFLAIGKLDAVVDSLTAHARTLIQAFDTGRKLQKHC